MSKSSELNAKQLRDSLIQKKRFDESLLRTRREFILFEHNGVNAVDYASVNYASGEKFPKIKAMGASSVAIIPIWRQATLYSTTITHQMVDDNSVRLAIRKAKAAGLKVMLKPHLDVEPGVDGVQPFRGAITPTVDGTPTGAADWDTWFTNYRTWINGYAQMAQEEDVDIFCIGCELRTSSVFWSKWSPTIAGIRAIYSGPLTYAALAADDGRYDKDEFFVVPFWDLLDIAGCDFYFPFTDKNEPSVDELVDAWYGNRDGQNLVKMILDWQRTSKKPFMFTEIGIGRYVGANKDPGVNDEAAPKSNLEQQNFAEAFYKVWSNLTAACKGFFWWSYDLKNIDSNYTIEDKPAQDVLSKWFNTQIGVASDDMNWLGGKSVLSADTTIGLLPPLTPLNHASSFEDGNRPHLYQYVEFKGWETIRTETTTANYWTKVASIRLLERYKYVSTRISILGSGTTDSSLINPKADVYFRVKQDNAMGSDPVIKLTVTNHVTIVPGDLVAITTVRNRVDDDHGETVVELYCKVRNQFQYYNFNPYHTFVDRSSAEFNMFSRQAFTATYPSTGLLTVTASNEEPTSYSLVRAAKSASIQAISANSVTQFITFDAEFEDILSEFDGSTGTFIPQVTDLYVLQASVEMDTPPANARVEFIMEVNGAYREQLALTNPSTNSGFSLKGFSLLKLTAGDAVRVRVQTTQNLSAKNNATGTFFRVTRFRHWGGA